MSEDWEEQLRQLSVLPTAPMGDQLAGRVRRRRRRRALGGMAAAAAGVVGVAALGAIGPGPGTGSKENDGPGLAVSPTPAVSAPVRSSDPETFACATESKIFDPEVLPEHPFIQQHKRAYAEIVSRDYTGFSIRRIEVMALGVMVLVEGDAAKAQRELTALGASGVRAYDPDLAAVGEDELGQIEQMMNWRLEPVLREARSRVRGVPGSAGFALWRDAGAILVQWKAPVPQKVQALEHIAFKTGGRIIVESVRYSTRDTDDAGQRLFVKSQEQGFGTVMMSSSRCADGSGLVVGVEPDALERRRAELQRKFSELAGMPVYVVPGERALFLPGTASPPPTLPSE